jgi:hypothetical protein
MTWVLKDHEHGYFRGTLDDEDVVWTQQQGRALRFRDKDSAELAMVGFCPNASLVKLRTPRAKDPR